MNNKKVIVTRFCSINALTQLIWIIWAIVMLCGGIHFGMKIWAIALVSIFIIFDIPFLLSMANEKVIVSEEGIEHVSLIKRVRKYRWGDVCKVYLDSCGSRTNAQIIIEFYDRRKIKLPSYLRNYELLHKYLVDRGIFGMYSESPLYYYSNMEYYSRYQFDETGTEQSFDERKADISEVIDKVKSKDFLLAADLLNQKTNIGMDEAFLYIRQLKAKLIRE